MCYVSLYYIATCAESSWLQFVYMAKGKDTMIQENMKEEITESSGLQLGTATMDTLKTVEGEISDLRTKNDEVKPGDS